ncbi:heterokaryon incompatibility protein-domain-containing protein [Amylocarpus encephaloides]|uniref:Heterokaryon incompatibility protein-domain-containing protein n=1 Tax=Amylocarpus encephaloides TaxID=45428 RepID=A0A9P7YJI3_9HELO|nr:heterokaryon incompatibility protein-domain-containing protein [Amylocarpus encephaloides]
MTMSSPSNYAPTCDACKATFEAKITNKKKSGHHATLSGFFAAVTLPCYICRRIFQRLEPDHQRLLSNLPEDLKAIERNDQVVKNSGGATTFYWEVLPRQHVKIWVEFNGRYILRMKKLISVSSDNLIGTLLKSQGFEFVFSAKLDQTGRPNSVSTNCREGWQLVSSQLSDCLSSHLRCGSRRDSTRWRPTRLLDIGYAPGRFRIVEGSEILPEEDYITLSHKWGKDNPLALTVSNLSQMKEGVASTILSKTFQDAIIVAQHLNIRYVWIDSLCIIQAGDNGTDKQREIIQMDKVYRNSLLNVSADLGLHGIFSERDLDLFTPMQTSLCIEIENTDGEFTKDTYQSVELDVFDREVSDAPLNRRGWVLQERVLAPRTLHFCRREIFWECCENIVCESFPRGFPEEYLRPHHMLLFKRFDAKDTVDQYYETWNSILTAYGQCEELTVPDDKLIAISGIARYIKGFLEDRYIAGLWLKSLAGQMLWYIASAWPTKTRHESNLRRAPSFSWASIDDKFVPALISPGEILVDVSCLQSSKTGSPLEEDVFGPLDGTSLQLKVTGRLKLAKIRNSNGIATLSPLRSNPNQGDSQQETILTSASVRFDFRTDTSHFDRSQLLDYRQRVIYYIPWQDSGTATRPRLLCILFELVDPKRGHFRRIGISFVFQLGDRELLLQDQFNERTLPGRYDERSGKHVIYVL